MLYTINYLASRLNKTPQTIRNKLKRKGLIKPHRNKGEKITLAAEEVRQFLFLCYKRHYKSWVENGDFEQYADPIPKGEGYIQRQAYGDKEYFYIRGLPLRFLDNGELEYFRGSSFTSKKDAESYRNELIKRRDNGEFVTTSESKDGSFTEYCRNILEEKRVDIRDSTYVSYKNIIEAKIEPFFGNMPIGQINRTILNKFMIETGMKSNTTYRVMKIILTRMYVDEITSKNLYDFLPKEKRKHKQEKHALTQSELKRYFDYMRSQPMYHVVRLMFYTGIRVGEALSLKWEDVHIESDSKGYVDIKTTIMRTENGLVDSEPKTPSSYRRVYFHDKELVRLLRDAKWKAATPYVAEKKGKRYMSTNAFNINYFNNPSRKLGFDFLLSSHYARVTYISYLCEQGVNEDYVRQQVGHKNTSLIHKVYRKSVNTAEETINQIDVYDMSRWN